MSTMELWNKIPTPLRLWIGFGLSALLIICFLRFGGKLSFGIGNWIFHRQVATKQAEVQKDLDAAAAQKKILEQTLRDLADAKKELVQAQHERELAEKLFNDQTKTSSEKVAEYKKALAAEPTVTDPTGVTIDDLCAKAKAANSSPATIAALCGK